MKKLLVLAMVAWIIALAPAALQISVDGNPDPLDSEIVAQPSDTLNLGLYGEVAAYERVYWFMVVDNSLATLWVDNAWGDNFYVSTYTRWMQYYAEVAPPEYVYSVGGWIHSNSSLSGLLIDDIDFDALTYGDAVVYLYSSPDAWHWVIADTFTVHIVPEPVTIALLGLGGLLISRRRKGERR